MRDPNDAFVGIMVVRERWEPIDSTLRRFKKVVDRAGVREHLRRHDHFVPKGERRRIKSRRARARLKP